MSTIVFINPPITGPGRGDMELKKHVAVPPEGLCLLAAVAREHGFKTAIVDALGQNLNFSQTVRKVFSHQPDYVGITATSVAIYDAVKLAKKLKTLPRRQAGHNPKLITILGGPHVTFLPKETLKEFPEIDIGVVGEGEKTIVGLLEAIEKKKDLKDVLGILFRNGKKIIKTSPRPFITNLDELPLPAWDLLPHLGKNYQQSVARAGRFPATSILTSRGCPGQCLFCACGVFGRVCRAYSAQRVLKMIKILIEKYDIRHIVINDDNFAAFRARLIELCQLLIKEKLDLTWSAFSRVDNVTPDILKLMKKAGCTHLAYGIESGSQGILDFAQKGITLKQIESAVQWTRDAGIRVTGYFILGFPKETRQTMQQTIDFAKKLPLNDVLFSYMIPYPGTQLYEIASQYGRFSKDWRKMRQWSVNFVPHGLTPKDLEFYYKKAFREFYFRPQILFSHFLQAFKPGHFGYYFDEGLNFLKFLISKKTQS